MKAMVLMITFMMSLSLYASEMVSIYGGSEIDISSGVELKPFFNVEEASFCYIKSKFDVCSAFFKSSESSMEQYSDGGHGYVETNQCLINQSEAVKVSLYKFDDYEGGLSFETEVKKCPSAFSITDEKESDPIKVSVETSLLDATGSVKTSVQSKNLKILRKAWIDQMTEVKTLDAYEDFYSLGYDLVTKEEQKKLDKAYDEYLEMLNEDWLYSSEETSYSFELTGAHVYEKYVGYTFSQNIFIKEYGDTCAGTISFDLDLKSGEVRNIYTYLDHCGGRDIPELD